MKYLLILSKQATLDEAEAYNRYEDIRTGLGIRFLENLENRYNALRENPECYSFSDSNNVVRDVAVDGFPYLIIYEIVGDIIVVLTIHNTYQSPKF